MWIDGFSGFGLFTLLTNFIGYVGWKSKEVKENKRACRRTYDFEKNTYLDMYCIERRPNGEYCRTERDIKTGDLVQTNKYNKIIRNISKEQREKESNNSDTTVIKMSEKNMHTHKYEDVFGIRYLDKATKTEYVIRWFKVDPYGMVLFYMDTKNGHLIRMTDGEKKYGKNKNIATINMFIEEFNKQQDNCRKHIWEKFYNDANWIDLKQNQNQLY